MQNKYIVYTAITGNKDRFLEPLYKDPEVTYICFTDDETLHSKIWDIKSIPADIKQQFTNSLGKVDSNRIAKTFKVLPHLCPELKNAEITMWIDGSILLKMENLKAFMNDMLENESFVAFQNTNRSSVKEEVEYCIDNNKDDPSILFGQFETYIQDGFPDKSGLVNLSVILRRNKDTGVKNLCNLWWYQIIKYSRRDEVSFPYVVWKSHFKYGVFPWKDRYNCPYIEVKEHNIK